MTTALDLALAAASSCAVTYEDGGSTFTLQARVTEHEGVLTVYVPENAVLTEERSRALAAATRAAVTQALEAAGYSARSRKLNAKGGAWRCTGYTLHRVFHVDGRYCQIVVTRAKGVDVFELDAFSAGALLRLRSTEGEVVVRRFADEVAARTAAGLVRSTLAGGFRAAVAALQAA